MAAQDQPARSDRIGLVTVLAVGLFVFAVFAYHCAPGLSGSSDTAEFQFVPYILGLAHQPGYPTFTLLGWAWTHLLPLGDPAYRMNLLSALLGAAAAALLCRLGLRLGAGPLLSAFVAVYFARAPLFAAQCVEAEVYSFHLLICAGLLDALVRWSDTRRQPDLLWACTWFALGIGHHTTILLWLPAILLFVALVDRGVFASPATLAKCAAVAACGLLPYVYILVRTPTAPFALMTATDLPGLANRMVGGSFRQFFLGQGLWHSTGARALDVLRLWYDNLGAGLLLAGLGAIALYRFRPALLALLALVFLLHGAMATVYTVPDADVYFLPGILATLVPIAAVRGLHASLARPRVGDALLAVLAVVLLLSSAGHWSVASRRGARDAAVYARTLVAGIPDPCVLLLPNWQYHMYVAYELYAGAGRGKQLYLCGEVSPPDIAAYLAGQGPVHPATDFPPGLPVVMPDQPPEPRPYEATGWQPVDHVARLRDALPTEWVGLGPQAFGREVGFYRVLAPTRKVDVEPAG